MEGRREGGGEEGGSGALSTCFGSTFGLILGSSISSTNRFFPLDVSTLDVVEQSLTEGTATSSPEIPTIRTTLTSMTGPILVPPGILQWILDRRSLLESVHSLH